MRDRLDKILIELGLISETEVRDALLRQKVHGGRFGSSLLYHRHIDEGGLVKALSVQLGCEGVVLSELDIPEDVVKQIPEKVAVARRVMPFEHDKEEGVLKVACLDPTDHDLVKELNFVAKGIRIQCYVAPEIALNAAIARYYMGRNTSVEANLLIEIPDDVTKTGSPNPEEGAGACDESERGAPWVLIATDEEFAAPLLASLLERYGYRTEVADSPDGVTELLTSNRFHSVLVRDSLVDDRDELAQRIRAISPSTALRFYTDAASLITGGAGCVEDEVAVGSLDVLTSLLAAKAGLHAGHSTRVGKYTEQLCRRLNLPRSDRFIITNAAYLHDVGRYYYEVEEDQDHHEAITLTVKLLTSLDYPCHVLEILRSMYTDLDEGVADHMPLWVLGGSVLTTVDLFCHAIPSGERLSLDRLDAVHKKLRGLAGKLLLGNVVEVFIDMIRQETLEVSEVAGDIQLMIYYEDRSIGEPLEIRLRNEGFRTVSATSSEEMKELCARSSPDVIILLIPMPPEEVESRVNDLRAGGIDFDRTPSFILVQHESVSGLTGLLKAGMEDVISLDQDPDLLVSKIHKLAARLESASKSPGHETTVTSGTSGRLTDMNLIDLLQALGPGQKTVKIAVHNGSPAGHELIIYLKTGGIVFAELGDLKGAPAIYEALAWTSGEWNVEPVPAEKIPVPNNELSNESILMEGCRLIDEKVKSGHLL